MTSINLKRHDARLGGDSRLRLAKHLQIVSTWGNRTLSLPYLLTCLDQLITHKSDVCIKIRGFFLTSSIVPAVIAPVITIKATPTKSKSLNSYWITDNSIAFFLSRISKQTEKVEFF